MCQTFHAFVDLFATNEGASVNLFASTDLSHVLLVGTVDSLKFADLALQCLHLIFQHQDVCLLSVLAHILVEPVGDLHEGPIPPDCPLGVNFVPEFTGLTRLALAL